MKKEFGRTVLFAALTLAGCGGGGGGGSTGGIAHIGGSGSTPDGAVYPVANTSGVHLLSSISTPQLVIPKIGSVYNFDGSQVAPNSKGQLTYYLADRNAPGLTVIDVASNTKRSLADAAHFPGQIYHNNASDSNTDNAVYNEHSGPNGLAAIPNTDVVFLGSQNFVVAMDASKADGSATLKAFPNLAPVGGTFGPFSSWTLGSAPDGNRADGGCFIDTSKSKVPTKAYKFMMFQHPDESPPYVSFYRVESSPSYDASVPFAVLPMDQGTLGLEGCIYDSKRNTILLTNDGTSTNPGGELDILNIAAIVGAGDANYNSASTKIIDPAVVISPDDIGMTDFAGNTSTTIQQNRFAISCNGFNGQGVLGIDINSNTGDQVGIACDPPIPNNDFANQVTVIGDISGFQTSAATATAGFNQTVVPGLGGSDQIAFDPVTNRYFVAARRYTISGVSNTTTNKFPGRYTGSANYPIVPTLGVIDATTLKVIGLVPAGSNDHSVAVGGGKVFVPYGPGNVVIPGSGIGVYSTH